jgi:type IV secretion system protein VirD4
MHQKIIHHLSILIITFIAYFLLEFLLSVFDISETKTWICAIPLIFIIWVMGDAFIFDEPKVWHLLLLFTWGLISIYHVIESMQQFYNATLPMHQNITTFWQRKDVVVAFVASCFAIGLGIYSIKQWFMFSGLLQQMQKIKKQTKVDTFGHADWMPADKLKHFTNDKGILIGKMREKPYEYIRHSIEGHLLTIAPPRSGKLISSIVPNLIAPHGLGWQGPAVVICPKGENYAILARRRRQLGREVILIDDFGVIQNLGKQSGFKYLEDAITYCFNPLQFIRKDINMVADIGALLDALVPELSNNSESLHFQQGARRIIGGFIAWSILTIPNASLLDVKKLLNQPFKQMMELFKKMQASTEGFGLPQDAANLMLNIEERERGSMYSTATNMLDFLKYPQIQTHTSHSDFDLNKLLDNKIDIFIVIPSHLISELKAWIRLWITLIIQLLSQRMPKERILLVIDEISALGKIEPLKRAFNLTAGLGLSIWGFTQHLNDLKQAYGLNDALGMLGMAEVLQFYNVAPQDRETLQYISEIAGEKTVLSQGLSVSRGVSGRFVGRSLNTNTDNRGAGLQETHRRLINPDEIARLSSDYQIVFVNAKNKPRAPMLLEKVVYYQTKLFDGVFDENPIYNK